jgi:hypothetical protein
VFDNPAFVLKPFLSSKFPDFALSANIEPSNFMDIQQMNFSTFTKYVDRMLQENMGQN